LFKKTSTEKKCDTKGERARKHSLPRVKGHGREKGWRSLPRAVKAGVGREKKKRNPPSTKKNRNIKKKKYKRKIGERRPCEKQTKCLVGGGLQEKRGRVSSEVAGGLAGGNP